MKNIYILIVLAELLNVPAFSQYPQQDKNWQIVFEDDFSTFNTTRWSKGFGLHGDYEYGNPKKQNEEPQVYLQDNVFIQNGKLVLQAQKQTYPCPKGMGYENCMYGGIHSYTSGKIVSNSKYKYGYFEIYAKLPTGTAFFPAFWLWQQGPDKYWYNEIDIMEANGCDPTWTSNNYKAKIGNDSVCFPHAIHHSCNYANGSYHWFGVEWDSKKIIWYIDRKIVREISNDTNGIGAYNPLQIIINLALFPPTWDSCYPINNALFPATMNVEQCNHYQLKYDCNTVVNEISNYNTFNYAVKKSIALSGISSLSLGQNVFLRATDFIELKEGFTVPNGAELYLDNNPCEIKTNIRGNEF